MPTLPPIVDERSLPPPGHIDERLARLMRPGTLSFAALPPLSLYVHLPWCLKKCPYCDFNSHEWRGEVSDATAAGSRADRSATEPATNANAIPEARYLDALRADLEAALPFIWGRRIVSVFIGGGTPSLFTPTSIERLLGDIRARLPLEPGCEITLEANPGTFERDRFRGYRRAGVNRLSIGVQSLDDAKLKALGRVHDAAQARAAIDEARDAFDTFNIDLMFALPGQTIAEAHDDLARVLGYAPPHLSLYHLTIEANTVFASRPPSGMDALPPDDDAFEMLDNALAQTTAAGLQRYEVSAYARAGHRCMHNLNYWAFGDYLGIGAGAHSKLTYPHRVIRQTRLRSPVPYMVQALGGSALSQEAEVPRHELGFEFILNALRLTEGFEIARFHERTGLPLHAIELGLQAAEQKSLITRNFERIAPTARGTDFLSDLQALFLADR